MIYNIKKRNTPIATLIKNFVNKKSGKVIESREEIQRRFDYLDWKDQKKIVLAFLDSGKKDRQWAYAKTLEYWDKSFEPKMQDLWERLHEEKSSWTVIRYFPEEYLSDNIDKFTEDRDYYFVCLRLAKNMAFEIDKSKLSNTDYLAVLYHTGRSIEEVEAESLLYENVHSICLDCDPYFALDKYASVSKGTIISPISFKEVSLALYYIKKLGLLSLTSKFEQWNKTVIEAVFGSPEFKAIPIYDINDVQYINQMITIARKYAYIALDTKYKNPSDPSIDEMLKPKEWYYIANEPINESKDTVKETPMVNYDPTALKEMMENNPALGKLVNSLALGTDEATLPLLIPD